jgi:hypothetical protein
LAPAGSCKQFSDPNQCAGCSCKSGLSDQCVCEP